MIIIIINKKKNKKIFLCFLCVIFFFFSIMFTFFNAKKHKSECFVSCVCVYFFSTFKNVVIFPKLGVKKVRLSSNSIVTILLNLDDNNEFLLFGCVAQF
jgi:hypothetical protein